MYVTQLQDDYVYLSGADATAALDKLVKANNPEPMVVDPTSPSSDTLEPTSEAHSLESQLECVQDMVGVETVRVLCAHPGDMEIVNSTIKTTSTSDASMENENQVNGNIEMESQESAESTVKEVSTKAGEAKGNTSDEVTGSPVKSSCTNIERPSPNCAIFDFKHLDTDNDEPRAVSVQANLNLVDCDPSKNKVYQVRRANRSSTRRSIKTRLDFSGDEEVDHEALQKIIDSAILDPDWLNCNMASDLEFSGAEGEEIPEDQVVPNTEKMDTGSEGSSTRHIPHEVPEQKNGEHTDSQVTVQRQCSKESILQLVSGAEKLVREPSNDDPSPIVSPRAHLQPLPLNSLHASSKQARVRQWLAQQRQEVQTALTCVQDSCDASGELTTGESDIESATSDLEVDASTATQKGYSIKGSTRGSRRGSLKGSKDALPSCENTPTSEKLPLPSEPAAAAKVILRGRKRRQGEQRPWSVSELYQLTTRMDLQPFSVSETAIHNLLSTTPETTPTNPNAPKLSGEMNSSDQATPTSTHPLASPMFTGTPTSSW